MVREKPSRKEELLLQDTEPCPGSKLIIYSKEAIQYCSFSLRQEWGDWGMSDYNFWLCLCMQAQGTGCTLGILSGCGDLEPRFFFKGPWLLWVLF